jgi:hypothetical protein
MKAKSPETTMSLATATRVVASPSDKNLSLMKKSARIVHRSRLLAISSYSTANTAA